MINDTMSEKVTVRPNFYQNRKSLHVYFTGKIINSSFYKFEL